MGWGCGFLIATICKRINNLYSYMLAQAFHKKQIRDKTGRILSLSQCMLIIL